MRYSKSYKHKHMIGSLTLGSLGKSGKSLSPRAGLLFFSGFDFHSVLVPPFEWRYGRVFMVHKRSRDKLLQRQIRRIIYSQSYSDRFVSETVSQVSREDVIAFLNQPVCVSDVPDVEKGEVLVDSRGQGSFQR